MAEAHPQNPVGAEGTRHSPRGAPRPIVSPGGAALIDSGHHLAPALNEALLRARLQADEIGAVAEGEEMTVARLAADLEELLDREPILRELMPGTAERRQFAHIFATLPLSPRLGSRLAIAARDRRELYVHSLRVAFCAGALAQRLHLARHEVADAVAGGLFHDLGLIYVDPALLQAGRRLDPQQRHHLDVHPFAGYLMLEDDPAWHPVVSTAVMEHHERLDGSGYPRGLSGSRLGEAGQLLAVAELAATLLAPGDPALSWLRLGVVLRLNAEKLNRGFVYSLLEAMPRTGQPQSGDTNLGAAIEILVQLAIAFQGWKPVRAAAAGTPLATFVDQRLDHLCRSLADAGIDLDYWQELDAEIERDVLSVHEICLAAREGLRQLIDIADETRRRWARLQPSAPEVFGWVDNIDALSR